MPCSVPPRSALLRHAIAVGQRSRPSSTRHKPSCSRSGNHHRLAPRRFATQRLAPRRFATRRLPIVSRSRTNRHPSRSALRGEDRDNTAPLCHAEQRTVTLRNALRSLAYPSSAGHDQTGISPPATLRGEAGEILATRSVALRVNARQSPPIAFGQRSRPSSPWSALRGENRDYFTCCAATPNPATPRLALPCTALHRQMLRRIATPSLPIHESKIGPKPLGVNPNDHCS